MAEPSFIDQSKLRFREGEIIFRKGEMAQQMYIILQGKVRLYVTEEAKGDWAEELAKGEFFGEGSLLEALPRQHTAIALEDSDLIAINRGTFLRMIRQNPEVSVKMMQRLAQRHREVGERLESLDAARPAKIGTAPVANLVSVLSGKPHPILSHGSLIGRFDPTTGVHPDIDLTEEDHNLSVSRRHARILCEHGRYFLLEEPGVANGTFVRGERILPGEPRELKHGDRVGFGMVVLFFERLSFSLHEKLREDDMGTDLLVELWRDEHGVIRELVQFGLDEIGGACIIRERNSLDAADGDGNEGDMVIARFGDPEDARDLLRDEGFEQV